MAVYTPLSRMQIEAFLASYTVGELVDFEGIAEGVENSNFLLRVQNEAGRITPYILTLFEQRTAEEDLPYCVGLMEHLSSRGIHCPTPIKDEQGQALKRLYGRPALMVSFLEGAALHAKHPLFHHKTVAQELGIFCADMHVQGADFSQEERYNELSLEGWKRLQRKIREDAEIIEPGLTDTIAMALEDAESHWPQGLPGGPVHADLFPDNIFFADRGGQPVLRGVIDFYFACDDMWMYDFAIVVNAWAFTGDVKPRFDSVFFGQLLKAYTERRASLGKAVTKAEKQALPVLCRGAALRFLLTRAHDWLFPVPGALVTPKDPREYLEKLRFHQGIADWEAYLP